HQLEGRPGRDSGDLQIAVNAHSCGAAREGQVPLHDWVVELRAVDDGEAAAAGRVDGATIDGELLNRAGRGKGRDHACGERLAGEGVESGGKLRAIADAIPGGRELAGVGAENVLADVGNAVAVGIDAPEVSQVQSCCSQISRAE